MAKKPTEDNVQARIEPYQPVEIPIVTGMDDGVSEFSQPQAITNNQSQIPWRRMDNVRFQKRGALVKRPADSESTHEAYDQLADLEDDGSTNGDLSQKVKIVASDGETVIGIDPDRRICVGRENSSGLDWSLTSTKLPFPTYKTRTGMPHDGKATWTSNGTTSVYCAPGYGVYFLDSEFNILNHSSLMASNDEPYNTVGTASDGLDRKVVHGSGDMTVTIGRNDSPVYRLRLEKHTRDSVKYGTLALTGVGGITAFEAVMYGSDKVIVAYGKTGGMAVIVIDVSGSSEWSTDVTSPTSLALSLETPSLSYETFGILQPSDTVTSLVFDSSDYPTRIGVSGTWGCAVANLSVSGASGSMVVSITQSGSDIANRELLAIRSDYFITFGKESGPAANSFWDTTLDGEFLFPPTGLNFSFNLDNAFGEDPSGALDHNGQRCVFYAPTSRTNALLTRSVQGSNAFRQYPIPAADTKDLLGDYSIDVRSYSTPSTILKKYYNSRLCSQINESNQFIISHSDRYVPSSAFLISIVDGEFESGCVSTGDSAYTFNYFPRPLTDEIPAVHLGTGSEEGRYIYGYDPFISKSVSRITSSDACISAVSSNLDNGLSYASFLRMEKQAAQGIAKSEEITTMSTQASVIGGNAIVSGFPYVPSVVTIVDPYSIPISASADGAFDGADYRFDVAQGPCAISNDVPENQTNGDDSGWISGRIVLEKAIGSKRIFSAGNSVSWYLSNKGDGYTDPTSETVITDAETVAYGYAVPLLFLNKTSLELSGATRVHIYVTNVNPTTGAPHYLLTSYNVSELDSVAGSSITLSGMEENVEVVNFGTSTNCYTFALHILWKAVRGRRIPLGGIDPTLGGNRLEVDFVTDTVDVINFEGRLYYLCKDRLVPCLETRDGEIPQPSEVLRTILPVEVGSAVCARALDSVLVIFCENGILGVSGQPPNDTGIGAPQNVFVIWRGIGCDNVGNATLSDDGIYFSFRGRPYLLNRGRYVVDIGEPVASTVQEYNYNCTRVEQNAGTREVFYILEYGTSVCILVFHMDRKAWTRWLLTRAGTEAGSQAVIVRRGTADTIYIPSATMSTDGLATRIPLQGASGDDIMEIATNWVAFGSSFVSSNVHSFWIEGGKPSGNTGEFTFRVYYDLDNTNYDEYVATYDYADDESDVYPDRGFRIKVPLKNQRATAFKFSVSTANDPIITNTCAMHIPNTARVAQSLPAIIAEATKKGE